MNPFGKGHTYNFVGKRFFNFIVLERLVNRVSKSSDKEYVVWKCLCDCGKEFISTTKSINKKDHPRKSCGCLSYRNRFLRTLSDEEANLNKIISHYKRAAMRRNYTWDLTDNEAYKFLLSNCFYCGRQPSRTCNYIKYRTAVTVSGIDRVDNDSGYCIDNCVSCCAICNRAKLNLGYSEFLEWIKELVNFQQKTTLEDKPPYNVHPKPSHLLELQSSDAIDPYQNECVQKYEASIKLNL